LPAATNRNEPATVAERLTTDSADYILLAPPSAGCGGSWG